LNNAIIKKYSSDIDKFLSNKPSRDKLIRHIGSYIQKNNQQLNHNVPIYRIPFNMNGPDNNIVFEATKIRQNEMKKDIRNSKEIKKYADVTKNPLFFTLTHIIHEIDNNIKKFNKAQEREFNSFLMYLSLSMYWSLQYRTFPYEPNDNIAQYTIGRLSNKFYFKKYKTVSEVLLVTATQNHENFKDMQMSDENIIKYIMSLRTRISNSLKNFAKELYKDIDEGNYLNSTFSDNSEENYIPESGNISASVINISNKVVNKFTNSRIDSRILSMSARMTNTSPYILRNTLEDVRKNEIANVRRLIINILSAYVESPNNPVDTIGGTRFIKQSIALYSKSNTSNKNIIEIKDILEKFLTKYNSKYNETERQATKSTYKKTMFIYFILLISDTL